MKKALFHLIKSMSRGEKRSFNLFAKRYDKTNTSARFNLYNILKESPDFQEKQVRQKFSKHQKIKQLPVTAHQLFHTVLDGLREYMSREYEVFEISQLMDYASLLYHRGLFKEAANKIDKAKKLAYQLEYFDVMPRILTLETNINRRLLGLKEMTVFKKNHWAEMENILNILNNQMEYGKLADEIYETYRRYGLAANKADAERYDKIMKHPLLQNINKALSLQSKGVYHTIFQIYNNAIQNFQQAQKHVLQLIELYEANGQYLRFRISSYITINNNAIFTWSLLKDYPRLIQNIEKMRQLPLRFPNLEAYYLQRIFESTYSIELSYYLLEGMIPEAQQLIPAIEEGLKQFPGRGIGIDRSIGISLGVAIAYFLDGQLQPAKVWIDKIIALEKEKTALHIVGYAKIIDLMLHYDWTNYLYLQNYCNKVQKFLKRHQRLFEIETGIIKLLKKLSSQPSHRERTPLIEQFLDEFKANQSKFLKHFLFSHARIHLWLETHLTPITVRELINKKHFYKKTLKK